jgi:hypothetical protein
MSSASSWPAAIRSRAAAVNSTSSGPRRAAAARAAGVSGWSPMRSVTSVQQACELALERLVADLAHLEREPEVVRGALGRRRPRCWISPRRSSAPSSREAVLLGSAASSASSVRPRGRSASRRA